MFRAPATTSRWTVGAAVPQSVALQPMPARIAEKVPQVKSHEFFVKNDKIASGRPEEP